MKTKTALKTAAALSAVMLLAACPGGDDDKSNNNNASAEAELDGASLTERYLINVDLPTSRNGTEFTVSLSAYCNKIAKDDNYVANCTQEAQEYVDRKFECSRFPLAPGGTKINSEEVLARGLQGNYREFPSQYLFTDEELEAAVEMDQTRFNKNNFFVINGVSDLDTAAETFPQGVPNAGPQCDL